MVHSTDATATADLVAVREWIRNFFNCEDCREHFLSMSGALEQAIIDEGAPSFATFMGCSYRDYLYKRE